MVSAPALHKNPAVISDVFLFLSVDFVCSSQISGNFPRNYSAISPAPTPPAPSPGPDSDLRGRIGSEPGQNGSPGQVWANVLEGGRGRRGRSGRNGSECFKFM